jgi:hypothetical protein
MTKVILMRHVSLIISLLKTITTRVTEYGVGIIVSMLHIRNVPGSILFQKTDHPTSGYSWLSSVPTANIGILR